MTILPPKSTGKALVLGCLAAAASAGWAFAQTATAQVAGAAPAAPVPDKGDTAWMLVSTALVLMMSVPGLALFYGGLVRSKNMLSVLSQVFMIVSLVAIVWVRLRLLARLHLRARTGSSAPSSAALTAPSSAA